MKNILKYFYIIVCTVVLILGAAFIAEKEDSFSPYFQLTNAFGQQNISIFDAQDGNHYVFLPSYSSLEQLQPILPKRQTFFLNDVCLSSHMSCDGFELEKPYAYSVNGETIGTLWFYRSENVATMFLDTVSGTMQEIHGDKNHEEYASMTLYSTDGSINFYDASSRLKGRGNATWERDKRPYVLTLSSDGNLLDMGSGKKWVLLANAYDETNLNNKLVFDLASRVGFEWSPDCRFVDLYLNGEYSGLYLLTEKIEVAPNRLDLDAASGDFLCMIDIEERKEILQQPFETEMGRIMEVCYPEDISGTDSYRDNVSIIEQELCSGADLNNSILLDLDSWVRRYLIDEISGNIDADLTSSYFYFSGGKFYAGPVWDYDMAFGNNYRNQEPHAFLAKNEKKSTDDSSPYYAALYSNKSFYQRLQEVYRTEFAPILHNLIDRELDDELETIQAASEMNSIRWRIMYDAWINETAGTGIVRNPEKLKSYITRRVQFLDRAWLENQEFCTVQFVPGSSGPFWNISVEKGSYLETTYMDLANSVWLDLQTGLPVDFQKPITQDLTVMLKTQD